MKILYLSATVVLLSALGIQAGQKRFMLEIYNVTCQSLTNHTKLLKCDYTKVANGLFIFNAKLIYDRKFGKESELHLRLRITPWNGDKSYNFLDFKLNLCMLTSQVVRNVLLQNLFNELIRSSNIPLDCSYKANYLYKIDNYSLSDKLIPPYAPYLNATFNVDFFRSTQIMGNLFAQVALIPQRKD